MWCLCFPPEACEPGSCPDVYKEIVCDWAIKPVSYPPPSSPLTGFQGSFMSPVLSSLPRILGMAQLARHSAQMVCICEWIFNIHIFHPVAKLLKFYMSECSTQKNVTRLVNTVSELWHLLWAMWNYDITRDNISVKKYFNFSTALTT